MATIQLAFTTKVFVNVELDVPDSYVESVFVDDENVDWEHPVSAYDEDLKEISIKHPKAKKALAVANGDGMWPHWEFGA